MFNSALIEFMAGTPVFRSTDFEVYLEGHPDHGIAPPKANHLVQKGVESGQVVEIGGGVYTGPEASASLDSRMFPYYVAGKAFHSCVLAYETALRFYLEEPPPTNIPVLVRVSNKPWDTTLGGKAREFQPVMLRASLKGHPLAESTVIRLDFSGIALSITSRERTLVDILDRPDLACDLGACWKALPSLFLQTGFRLDQAVLLSYLDLIPNRTAAARVGHFLQVHGRRLGIAQSTLKAIREMGVAVPCRWHEGVPGRKDRRWRLFVPESLIGWVTRDLSMDFDPSSVPGAGAAPDNLPDDSEEADGKTRNSPDDEIGMEGQLDSGELEGKVLPLIHQEEESRTYLGPHDIPIQEPDFDEDTPSFSLQLEHPADPYGLLPLLKLRFGHDSFLPGQMEVIQALLEGKDALAILPTAGGKSLIYQYLTMARGGTTLVISPLLALMDDQIEEAQGLGLRAASLNSTLSDDEWIETYEKLMGGELDILFISPEGLFSICAAPDEWAGHLRLIVVDEAHCISAWGHDFRPAYRDLHNLKRLFAKVPILALTATAPADVQRSICHYLAQETPFLFVESVARANLWIMTRNVPGGIVPRISELSGFLLGRKGQQGIVYCATRKATARVASELSDKGFVSDAYHAGLDHKKRREVFKSFKDGKCKIVVATIAFGMGVNKKDIRFVVHMNLPGSIEGYVQEVGRAGRDRAPADCLLLYSEGDLVFQRFLAGKTPESHRGVKEAKILRMWRFAERSVCRHQAIAMHFEGEKGKECRNRCDSCCKVRGRKLFRLQGRG